MTSTQFWDFLTPSPPTIWGSLSVVRFWRWGFGEFPRLVGRYCSYLLPKQARGTPQILIFKTPRPIGRPRLYFLAKNYTWNTQVNAFKVNVLVFFFVFFCRYAEDFWALYHHLEEACNLGSGQDYCLFKVWKAMLAKLICGTIWGTFGV